MTWTWKTNERDEVYVDRHDGSGFLRPTLNPDHPANTPLIARTAQWAELAKKIGEPNGVPLHWSLGVIFAESGGDPNAQSTIYDKNGVAHPGARGLMQVMPATAESLGYAADSMWHPPSNIGAGTTLLGDFRANGFDLPASLSMYNAGPAVPMRPKVSTKSPWGFVENDGYITRAVMAANYFRRDWKPEIQPKNGNSSTPGIIAPLALAAIAYFAWNGSKS